jgi:peptide/nickel transport system substrate-binding protein
MNMFRKLLPTLLATLVALTATGAARAAGTITLLDSFDNKDWDPAVIYSSEVRTLMNVYEMLTRYNFETGQADPMLAESWSVSDDKLTWTFKLRPGVKFHDGSAFNAAAAKASIDRTIEIAGGPAYIWSGVKEITAPDELTLVFKTEFPMAIDLIAASGYGAFMLGPAAIDKGKDWLQEGNAIGTGPYRLKQWDKSQQIVFEKFDDYWGGWTGEEFDRIILRLVAEVSTQVQLLRGGEGDLMLTTAPYDMLQELEKDSALKVSVFESWLNIPIMLNAKLYPTDNVKFRQALAHLIDAEAVAGDIYAGYGTVPKSCVPQAMWGAGQFDLPKLDIEKAKQLLEESGIPKSDWKVTYHAYTGREEIMKIAELYQALAAQAGVEVELVTGEWGVLWDKQKKLETSANMMGVLWWADWATPTGWLSAMWHTEDPTVFNFSHYSNPEVDALLDEGIKLQGADRNAAAEKFIKAQEIIYLKDTVGVCPVEQKKAVIHRADIEGVGYNPAYETVSIYPLRRKM